MMALRFGGDDLDPDRLTALLGAQPNYGLRKGEVTNPDSLGTKVIAKKGAWMLNADDLSPGDMDKQIHQVFSLVTDDLNVWRELAIYEPDVFFGLFLESGDEGTSLSVETMRMLADRGVTVEICMYAYKEDERPALFRDAQS
jgi:hypothetical protein